MRGLWEQLARVLANRPLEAAGAVFQMRGPVLLKDPTGQRQNPARTLPLGILSQIFLAYSGTDP